MQRKDFFKLGLLISASLHFSFIIIFPLWNFPKPKKPEIMQVSLIELKPEQVKSKQASPEPPSPPPAPPPEQKAEQKAPPKISPVKVAVKISQNIPVLTPRAESKSNIQVPFPSLSFGPETSPEGERAIYYKKEEVSKKSARGLPTDEKAPPKISSPVQGETPSFNPPTPSRATGPGGASTAQEQPVGITFGESLGTREVIYQPEFIYPEEMERKGKQGTGKIEVDVLPSGQVVDVRIVQSSGSPAFDQEIIRKASYIKFSSIKESGIKTYPGEFSFRLQD